MKYVLSLLVVGVGSVAFAGNACQTVATPVQVQHVQTVQVAQPVYVQQVQVQRVAVAQPVYVQRQVVQVAQPVYVQQVAVANQHQQFVAVQQNNVRGNGRVRNGNGGSFGNALNAIFSPQGILTIGGAAAGAAVAGPLGAPAGAAIGAGLGTILGNGLAR